MKAMTSVLALSFFVVGCASQQDLWQAQENIITNDNRLASALSDQHEQILSGSTGSLRSEIEALRRSNEEIDARAREIAEQAVSAKSIAADAIRGLETYLGGLGGPVGGVIGETLSSIEAGIRDQDNRLIAVEAEASKSGRQVEAIESSLDERIERQLRTLGLTEAEARVLRDNLSPAELLALIAVIGAGTGGGAFASKLGRSRSAPEINELKARVASIESKSNA